MAQAARLAARLQRELTMLQSDPPPGVCAWPCDDHLLTHLQAQIHGPQGTVYSNGIFKLDIQVPERYPFEPPNIRFVTLVYHPNIDNGGRICLDLLNLPPKGAWRPSLNLSTLLASIGLLLAEPNPDDGLMGEITAEYKHDRPSFDLKARRWTELYAIEGRVVSELGVAETNISSSMEANQNEALDQISSSMEAKQNEALDQGAMAVASDCDGSLVWKSGTSSEHLKSGSFSSKRLALDKGSTASSSQSKHFHTQKTGTSNPPPQGVANCSISARKSGENYSFKTLLENAQTETVKAAKPDKKPPLESCGLSGVCSREPLSDEHDSHNFVVRKKAQDCEGPSVEKENQSPNQRSVLKGYNVTASSLVTGDKGMARDKLVEVPSDVKNSTPTSQSGNESGRGKGNLCLSSGRAKSLKLSRGKANSQPSHAPDVQLMKQPALAETKRNQQVVIPDDVPTVIISDSGSDNESSDEGFTLSLTQRSLLNKRKR